MSAKMQVMFAAPRLSALRNASGPSSNNSGKTTKGELIKRLHKDNKSLFGDLVETKKEKAAREKMQKKITKPRNLQSAVNLSTKDNKSRPVAADTELHHIDNMNRQKLFKVKFMGKYLPYQTKKIIKISELKTTIGAKEIVNLERIPRTSEKSEAIAVNKNSNVKDAEISLGTENSERIPRTSEKSEVIAVDKNSDANNDAEISLAKSEPSVPKKADNLPSRILLNNMTSFSYLDTRKTVRGIQEGIQPVSISPYSDKTKLSIPSVTRILNKTMSPESKLNLELWKQRMILQLGQEGFEKYSQGIILGADVFGRMI